MRNIAIVTGASSGVGAEFVRQLGEGRGGRLDEIWLVARNQERLDAVASSCATPCRTFALDLCDQACFDVIGDALRADDDLDVRWLVNSAGFGKFGDFGDIGEVANANMVRLNCLAVVQMCYQALLRMHSGSRIVNLASAAAFVPQPRLSVYAASKSFVLSLSRSLDHELREVGIHVTAVCPKFMDTAFLDRPGDRASVADKTWTGFERPSDVVSHAIDDAIRGRALCIPSPDMRLAYVACRLLPDVLVMDLQQAIGRHLSR